MAWGGVLRLSNIGQGARFILQAFSLGEGNCAGAKCGNAPVARRVMCLGTFSTCFCVRSARGVSLMSWAKCTGRARRVGLGNQVKLSPELGWLSVQYRTLGPCF